MSKSKDIDKLVEEFDQETAPTIKCKVCDSEWLELIETLLDRSTSATAVSKFLQNKLGVFISESTLKRHRQMHGAAE